MIEDIIKERSDSYGEFRENATVAQLLKEAIQMETNYSNMPPYMRESLDIICSKISRMVTGSYKHEDNWVDIQGFAKLALDRLREDKDYEENKSWTWGGCENCLPREPLSFERFTKHKGFGLSELGNWHSDSGFVSDETMQVMYKEYLEGFPTADMGRKEP